MLNAPVGRLFGQHRRALLRQTGFAAALRWHLIERRPGRYDWSSFDSQRDASRDAGVTVVWDLLHYGWPRRLDPMEPEFVARFAEFAGEAAARIGSGGHYTPVNEISSMAWGGGEVAYLGPFRRDCADALKRNICRAAIAAAKAIRHADPQATIYTSEPLIHVAPAQDTADHRVRARHLIAAQHDEALTMLGETAPELGAEADLFDVIGLNYYPHNQFDSVRRLLAPDDPRRRTLAEMLVEARQLYRKPLILSETGPRAMSARHGSRRPAPKSALPIPRAPMCARYASIRSSTISAGTTIATAVTGSSAAWATSG